jgi:hypothetical protein
MRQRHISDVKLRRGTMEPGEITGPILKQSLAASPGESVRIGVNYKGNVYMLLWIKFSKDGSIYLMPRLGNNVSFRRGKKVLTNEDRKLMYEDLGEEIKAKSNLKMSFHPSGVINAGDLRTFRKPIRNISEWQELCQIMFIHPTKYRQIKKFKENDIILNPPINDEGPLCAYLSVANVPDHINIEDDSSLSIYRLMEGVDFQFHLGFFVTGIENVVDLFIQFSLYQGPKGPLPPATLVIWPTADGHQANAPQSPYVGG